MSAPSSGTIITFYSYKGGTGRTMAVANTACLLARKAEAANSPKRIVVIDWDFEAPGLHRYFEPYFTDEARQRKESAPGCFDLFLEVHDSEREAVDAKAYDSTRVSNNRQRARDHFAELDLDRFLLATTIPGLSVIKAGRLDAAYPERINDFDWEEFFKSTVGLFTGFADFLRERFDYVLIDSRTGETDTSGICTMLLPDKLVIAFTPNEQSLTGVAGLARRAVAYRQQSIDWRPLLIFPLASRIEMARPQLFEAWRRGGQIQLAENVQQEVVGYQPTFEALFSEIYGIKDRSLTSYFDEVLLQHVPDYAYGEPIAVELEKSESRVFLRRSYEAFIERLIELEAPWQSLGTVRQARELAEIASQATSRAEAGDLEEAIRSGLLLASLCSKSSLVADHIDDYGSTLEDGFNALILIARKAGATQLKVSKSLLVTAGELAESFCSDVSSLAGQMEAIAAVYEALGCYEEQERSWAQIVQLYERSPGERNASALAARTAWASALNAAGRLDEALKQAQMAADLYVASFGKDQLEGAQAQSVVAEILSAKGDWAGARAIQERVLALRNRVLGEEHQDTLISMNNLASILASQGNYAGARSLQEQTLAICLRVLGDEHPDTLNSMNNLARTFSSQGDDTVARTLHEQTLATRRRVQGDEHPDTLTSMNNLAATLASQGDHARARALQEQTLTISRRVLGEEHPDALTSMNNLASILWRQGDHGGARTLEEQTLAIRRRVLGDEHPDTLTSMNSLAGTLASQGDHAAARTLQDKTLAIRRRVLGEEHPDTLTSMNNLASIRWRQGDHAGARRLEEQALAISRRVLGEEHPATLTSMNNLAITLASQGDHVGARTLLEHTLALRRRMLGEEHPDTLTSMNNLAITLREQGDVAGARLLQERTLVIRRRVLGDEHPHTLGTIEALGQALQAEQDWEGAHRMLAELLERRRSALGDYHLDTLRAVAGLASLLNRQGRTDEATALLGSATTTEPQPTRAVERDLLGGDGSAAQFKHDLFLSSPYSHHEYAQGLAALLASLGVRVFVEHDAHFDGNADDQFSRALRQSQHMGMLIAGQPNSFQKRDGARFFKLTLDADSVVPRRLLPIRISKSGPLDGYLGSLQAIHAESMSLESLAQHIASQIETFRTPSDQATPRSAEGAIFLSYAHQDEVMMRRVHEALVDAGLPVWMDQRALRAGDSWRQATIKAVSDCAVFMPILSKQAANRSYGHFRAEWAEAEARLSDPSTPFMVMPIVVDSLDPASAGLPTAFTDSPIVSLPGGQVSQEFIAQVKQAMDAHARLTKP